MIDVIILNYNDFETTSSLIEKIINFESINKIIVIDNKSSDNSYQSLLKYSSSKCVILQADHNGGYGFGNNIGINYIYNNSDSKYALLCNPDVIFEENIIYQLLDFLESNNDYIIASPYMIDKNGNKTKDTAFKINNSLSYILSSLRLLNKIFKFEQYKNIQTAVNDFMDVEAVAGSLFMFDVRKMIEIGCYDENIFLYCEERVVGLKSINNGLKIALLPNISFIHNHSVSINKSIKSNKIKFKLLKKSKLYVLKKYYKIGFLKSLLFLIVSFISYLELLTSNFIGIFKRN